MRDDVLRSLHERFARSWGDTVTQQLRLPVDVRLAEVVSQTGGKFLAELEQPTCLYRLQAEIWKGDAWLDLNPAVLHPMLDRLLGGAAVADPIAKRPLTEIELRLSARILDKFVAELEGAWSCLVPIRLGIDKQSDGGNALTDSEREESIQVFRFQVSLGGTQGMATLGMPNRVLDRLENHLRDHAAARRDLGRGASRPSSPETRGAERKVDRVEVRVSLADTTIPLRDLRDLTVGDIITTDHDVDSPMIVSAAGTPRFLAAPGILRDRTAFRVLQPIAPEDEPETETVR